ncbi:MAG TPA: ferritin-like domain-containing protein [Polyangiales bacterium]|nr:ferritin-like domain-containing protein [Polyangiales bacterium]
MKRAPEACDAVRSEWLRRVEAEYHSAAITGQLAHWLIQLAAPPVLIRAALRIVADELRHAELSARVYRAAGGTLQAALQRERLELQRVGERLEHDATRVVVQTFCLGETAAVRLFHRLRKPCSVAVARAALDRILRDEVRHRDFGWRALEWLLSLPDAAERRVAIETELPGFVALLRANYAGDADLDAPPAAAEVTPATRAWGLMPRAEYRRAVEVCVERDLTPRFKRLGIAV